MKSIDVFYQGEGIREIEHIEVIADQSYAAVKTILAKKHGLGGDVLIFLEDCDEPADEMLIVGEHAGSHGIKVQLHRCRHIEVAVTFNAETVHHRFRARLDNRARQGLGGRAEIRHEPRGSERA